MLLLQTSGMIKIMSREEAIELLRSTTEADEPDTSHRQIIADLIVAIGQRSESHDPLRGSEKLYFSSIQLRALEMMLHPPSLDMVMAFLLMSFYMLGACRRNIAYMYLGVATRAAVVLGLHQWESYESDDRASARKK